MQLSTMAESKLQVWINAGTWDTMDITDMNRWYEFVAQLWHDHNYVIDEPALQEMIEHRIGSPVNDVTSETIRARIDLACKILDYLKHTQAK